MEVLEKNSSETPQNKICWNKLKFTYQEILKG